MKVTTEAIVTVILYAIVGILPFFALAGVTDACAQSYQQTCFKKGEHVDGLTKICYYRCTCGTKALNIKAHQVCPVNAKFSCQ